MRKDWKYWVKRSWQFLWHDDSAIAWVANVIVAFILIKFVIYPVAGLLVGTQLPVVAVVSSSMDHRVVDGELCGKFYDEQISHWEGCGEWYEERGITQTDFSSYIFPDGFWKGDVMMLKGVEPDEVERGDVLVFWAGKQYPIIHRVIDSYQEDGEWFFSTKGDHNVGPIEEYAITDGKWYYGCYQEVLGAVKPSLCGPGVKEVDKDTPNAIKIMDETKIPADTVIGVAVGRIPLIGYIKIWFVDLLNFVGLGTVAQVF